MNFLVRLDVNPVLGLGHLTRMKNLAVQGAPHTWHFLIKTDHPQASIFEGLSVCFVQDDTPAEIRDLVFRRHIDTVILDLLHYPVGAVAAIRQVLPQTKIVSFHEYPDFDLYSDLVINYNLFEGYLSEPVSNTYLFGPKFAIFSPDLIATVPGMGAYTFVSFGGSDPNGITALFLEQVAMSLPEIQFKVHLGPLFFQRNSLTSLPQAAHIELVITPPDLMTIMAHAKHCVVAGGNLMYESMFFRKPTCVIAQNTHQADFATQAAHYPGVRFFGTVPDINFSELSQTLVQWADTPIIPEAVFDTQGVPRLLAHIVGE